nr:sericin 1-like [Chrysemys picta bellii]
MPFKSHLAILVLGLCELHLIGSVNNDKIALIIQTNNKDKAVPTTGDKTTQDKTAPHSQPTSITQLTSKDKSQAPTTTHPTSNDKDKTLSTTHATSNDKDNTVSTAYATSNDKDNTVSTTYATSNDKDNTVSTTYATSNDKDKTAFTSNDKDKTAFTTQPNTDNVRSTTKLPKKLTWKSDTTSHPGGSAATIPSMFTIASLICVLLL